MKVGIIVDGQAEYHALPHLIPRLGCSGPVLNPLVADIQPLGPIGQIVRAVKARLITLKSRGATRVLILIDLETRSDCPGQWAHDLETALQHEYSNLGFSAFRVVIKYRMFENWLISDPDALMSLRKRFHITDGQKARIQPNKADAIDATSILSHAAID